MTCPKIILTSRRLRKLSPEEGRRGGEEWGKRKLERQKRKKKRIYVSRTHQNKHYKLRDWF